MSFVVVNAVTVPPERHEQFEARFAARAGTVSQAPGFEAFELLRPAEGDRYLVYTRWATRSDFDAWLASRDFRASHGSGQTPVASDNEVWSFEVLQGEYA